MIGNRQSELHTCQLGTMPVLSLLQNDGTVGTLDGDGYVRNGIIGVCSFLDFALYMDLVELNDVLLAWYLANPLET